MQKLLARTHKTLKREKLAFIDCAIKGNYSTREYFATRKTVGIQLNLIQFRKFVFASPEADKMHENQLKHQLY